MTESIERNYHLGFAQASLVGLFNDGFSEALRESWRAGTTITRYGRRWHLTKIIAETDDLDFGRIGFVNDDAASTLQFDRESNDFVHGEAPSGVVVPFAIRKSDGVIAYQLRPGIVRETTFTGALEELLNASGGRHVWEIRTFTEERNFSDWLGTYPIVTRFDFTLERPNPHYFGADRVEHAIEDVRLESIRLVGKARDGEAIDPTADLFQQAVDHVTRDYGKAKVVGSSPDGNETVWVKLRGVVNGRVAAKRTRRAVGTEEAPEALLREALSAAPGGELLNLNAQDDD